MESVNENEKELCLDCENPLNEDGECDVCMPVEEYTCEQCGTILEYEDEVCPHCEFYL